jgi:ABC-2 type transport system permease protein
VLPIAWSVVGAVIKAFDPVADRLDGSRSLSPLTEELLGGTQWAHVLTTLSVWMVLPLLVGAVRVARSEVK